MGLEMLGTVEIYRNGFWAGAIRVEPLVTEQSNSMFANLFGIMNDQYVFDPIVGRRGIPSDKSDMTSREIALTRPSTSEGDEDRELDSWISWDEIAAINWEQLQGRPWESAWPSRLDIETKDWLGLQNMNTRNRVARGYALTWEWEMLFEVMGGIADRLGKANVRLIVWFMR